MLQWRPTYWYKLYIFIPPGHNLICGCEPAVKGYILCHYLPRSMQSTWIEESPWNAQPAIPRSPIIHCPGDVELLPSSSSIHYIHTCKSLLCVWRNGTAGPVLYRPKPGTREGKEEGGRKFRQARLLCVQYTRLMCDSVQQLLYIYFKI